MTKRGRSVVLIVLGLVLTLGVAMAMFGVPGAERAQPRAAERAPIVSVERDGRGTAARVGEPARGDAPQPASEVAEARASEAPAARRAALRERLLAAEAAREAARGPQPEPEPAASPGELTDRTGRGDPALLELLNTDFMPLADECIATAREANPELAGMLAVGVELLADDELGAIVESVEFPPTNELDDQELQTCIRETALSMILPPAPSGRDAFMLTLPIEP